MLTPVDLETTVFRRGFRGYNTKEVQEFMEAFGHDFERLYRENLDLKEKQEELQKKLNQYQTIEDTLRNTMILAEETAEEAKSNAKQKAELVVREAELHAEAIKVQVKEDIQNELRNLALLKNQVEYFKCQFKSFLSGLLDMAEQQLDLNIVWEGQGKNMAAASGAKETSSNVSDKLATKENPLDFKATG
jgi:cell division initiation protein